MDILDFIDRTEPGSPTSTRVTPSSALPYEDGASRTLSELKDLGRTVYQEVWDEFYDWEPGYCAEILGTVTMSVLAPRKEIAKVAKAMVERFVNDTPANVTSQTARGNSDVVLASMASYSAGGRVRGRPTDVPITVITIDPSEALAPHPPYESCPPISRSVLTDVNYDNTLPFLPYADDKNFAALHYLGRFDYLEWDTPFDPDLEMIQIETVRRLHAKHNVELQDIDNMGLFKPLSVSNNTGLLWEQFQRDFLHWPGAFHVTLEEDLPTSRAPQVDDLKGRMMSILRTFCPSPNCLHAACETHGHLHTSSYIPSEKPTVTGESMRLTEGLPCGPDCFRLIQDFEKFRETLPPSPTEPNHASSLDVLETVLGIAPDLFPCQLAIICMKPCNEVFAQRLQLFPDHIVITAVQPGDSAEPATDPEVEGANINAQRNKRRRKSKLQFVDTEEKHKLIGACAHPGSCTSNQCSCFVEKQHCTLMCRCGVKCIRQWEGCNCTNGRCMLNSCSCLLGSRECIPGICVNCDAGGKDLNINGAQYIRKADFFNKGYTGKPCNNTKIQFMAGKPLEIKSGKYGLGAFALQNMNSNAFLGTYVGHILSNEAAEHMIELSKHTSLNYLFDTPVETMIDAAHIGNETRFLNHANDEHENVDARTLLVNGEYQIGFFTSRKIKAGEELFLNYGDDYWRDQSVHNMDEE